MTHTPFTLERLDHVVLRTGDVGRLVRFYQELGCSVVREVPGMQMVQLAAGRSMIDVVGVDDAALVTSRRDGKDGTGNQPSGDGRNMDHFALRVSPFDEAEILAFCKERGIEAQAMGSPLLGADGFGPAVYLRDPDGNRLELKGPPVAPRPDGQD